MTPDWARVVVTPQTGARRSTGSAMVGYWLKAEASSSTSSKSDDGRDKDEQGQARQGRNKAARSRYHGPVAPRSHGTRMDDGGRSFAEGVRDDWRPEREAARG